MIDVLSLLSDPDFVSEVSIERTTETVDGHGRTQVAITPGAILASVQPATPRERETLPEADRVKETIALWTVAAIDEDTRVFWLGKAFRVAAVEPWRTPGGAYTRALAVREDPS